MSPKSRVIIDTDPGVDDVLALLFALSASSEDIEVLLISVTYGNVQVKRCLRNVVAMFHVIEKELAWRKEKGQPEGFEALTRCKPLVAVGADQPSGNQMMMADYFHGKDGLGGVHTSHPHHSTPEETWQTLFEKPPPDPRITSSAVKVAKADIESPSSLFRASNHPSHLEILKILEDNPADTIDVIAIGPLTNLALAASHDPQTFLRAKSVLVMGGAVSVPGNITPVGEFNTLADPISAARVFALTSPTPSSTMPPSPPKSIQEGSDEQLLPPYPPKRDLGDRRLNLILFPLDITTPHELRRKTFEAKLKPLLKKGSPLAEWTAAFVGSTLRKMESLHTGLEGEKAFLSLHDPLCVWYALTADGQQQEWEIRSHEDIRIETSGQWTRGMCVVDQRDRKMRDDEDDGEGEEVPGDSGGWLSKARGNRIRRCIGTPGNDVLAPFMLDAIFG